MVLLAKKQDLFNRGYTALQPEDKKMSNVEFLLNEAFLAVLAEDYPTAELKPGWNDWEKGEAKDWLRKIIDEDLELSFASDSQGRVYPCLRGGY